MARGLADTRGRGAGNVGLGRAGGSASAALGGRMGGLDHDLARGVRLVRTHVLVVAMVVIVLVVPDPGVGVHRFRLRLIGLDDRCLGGLVQRSLAGLADGGRGRLGGGLGKAGAAMTETASNAAEMVLSMVVSSSRGSRRSPVGGRAR